MKPIIDTPDTLIVGYYLESGFAAAVGSLRCDDGSLQTDVFSTVAAPWEALCQVLDTAKMVDARHILILCNDANLVQALSPPFQAPAPATWKRVWLAKGEYGQVGIGGDPFHWQALQTLTMGWGGRFRAMQVNHLPKAKELWQQQQ